MISGYININTLVAKIYRTLGINYEIPFNDLVEFVAEGLGLIGSFAQYDKLSTCLDLVNGKAKLPCGFHKLSNITYNQQVLYWSDNSSATNYGCNECQVPICRDNQCNNTFYINNSYIITSIKDTLPKGLCIVYLGIPVDEEGFPLIPDDFYFMKALEAYVIHVIDRQEWRKGKITDKVKEESEKEWLFYCAAAKGSANSPNAAQLENLTSIMSRLMPMRREFQTNFRNMPKRENLNL